MEELLSSADSVEREHAIGLDLGQSNDPSALTVTQKRTPFDRNVGTYGPDREYKAPVYAVVWIERFDLGTSYTEVVDRVSSVYRAPETGENPALVMDATGIGGPVVDLFKDEGLFPQQVVFTGGENVNITGRKHKVPKQDLATTVQTLLQNRQIQIAEELEGAAQLVQEMKQFRVKWSQSGHARFEHATESDSDDVLLSLAAALWYLHSRQDEIWAA